MFMWDFNITVPTGAQPPYKCLVYQLSQIGT